jgi:site-specific DNA-methyltransferase (adenine-specific)
MRGMRVYAGCAGAAQGVPEVWCEESAMKPYYEHAGITIFHGDCREILPMLPKCDLLLTDPPYGVKAALNSVTAKRAPWSIGGSRKKNDYGEMDDSPEYVQAVVVPGFVAALAVCKRGILTPGCRCLTMYPQPDSFGSFWQPASTGLQRWGRCDSQPIFYYGSFPRESRLIPATNCSYRLTESPEPNGHPCPKPYQAWKKLLLVGSLDDETALDPFMGSGTTLVAAKNLGRKAIGIEIEEKYCEIAAKRLSQEVFDFS